MNCRTFQKWKSNIFTSIPLPWASLAATSKDFCRTKQCFAAASQKKKPELVEHSALIHHQHSQQLYSILIVHKRHKNVKGFSNVYNKHFFPSLWWWWECHSFTLCACTHTHNSSNPFTPFANFFPHFPCRLKRFRSQSSRVVEWEDSRSSVSSNFFLHLFLLLMQHKNLRVWKTSFVECGSNPLRSKGKLQLLRRRSPGAVESEEHRRSAGTSLMNSAAATLHN